MIKEDCIYYFVNEEELPAEIGGSRDAPERINMPSCRVNKMLNGCPPDCEDYEFKGPSLDS